MNEKIRKGLQKYNVSKEDYELLCEGIREIIDQLID